MSYIPIFRGNLLFVLLTPLNFMHLVTYINTCMCLSSLTDCTVSPQLQQIYMPFKMLISFKHLFLFAALLICSSADSDESGLLIRWYEKLYNIHICICIFIISYSSVLGWAPKLSWSSARKITPNTIRPRLVHCFFRYWTLRCGVHY